MGSLSDDEREAIKAKVDRDRQAQGLPPTVEDVGARKGLGALLSRLGNGHRKFPAPDDHGRG